MIPSEIWMHGHSPKARYLADEIPAWISHRGGVGRGGGCHVLRSDIRSDHLVCIP